VVAQLDIVLQGPLDAKEDEAMQPRAGSPVAFEPPPTPLNHCRTPSISSSASQSSKTGLATARKVSSKRSRVETSLEASVSENAKLLELAKGSYDFKTATIAAKRQKMELRAKQECEGQRYAAEERALMIKERMQEKEFEHRERMIKYELELARLKGQVPGTTPPQPALSSTAFSPGSSIFGQTTQADIYTTPDSNTFDNFTFPSQRSSLTLSPNSDMWGSLSCHGQPVL
jgi:hypothetical protein